MSDSHARSQPGSRDDGPCENTDRELWRGPDEGGGSFYADSIHVTKDGGIGINCGGTVYVKPLREWHRLAGGPISILNPPRLGVQISDDIVDRALTENVDLIQGFSYADYHCIRDFRQDYAKGVEIWRCPRSDEAANHGLFQKRLAHEKLKAQLIAAFAPSVTSADRGRE